jgi:GAF domain-containing protein
MAQAVQSGKAPATLERLERLAGGDPCTVEQACGELARIFRVRPHEVALLHLERRMLRFLYPAELRAAGAIPLSSSAVAARTASQRRADVFNSFATVQHSSVFETVKLGTAESAAESTDVMVIQKMMSAPVVAENGDVLGVVQVSRKGPTVTSAGPDFTTDDLTALRAAAKIVARMMPGLVDAPATLAVAVPANGGGAAANAR